MEDVALLVGNSSPAPSAASASASATATDPAGIHAGPICAKCGQAPGVFPTETGAVCEACASAGLAAEQEAERADAIAAVECDAQKRGLGWRLRERKAQATGLEQAESDVPLLVG
jgi:hypothetical protein